MEARVEIVALHELTLEHAERVPTAIMDVIDPPPVMPGTEPPQGPPYDVSAYTDRQWEEIKKGWASKVDTSLYSNPAFNAMQMHVIREGAGKGLACQALRQTGTVLGADGACGNAHGPGYDVTAVMVGGSPVDFTDPASLLRIRSGCCARWNMTQFPRCSIPRNNGRRSARVWRGGLDVNSMPTPGSQRRTWQGCGTLWNVASSFSPPRNRKPAEGRAEPMRQNRRYAAGRAGTDPGRVPHAGPNPYPCRFNRLRLHGRRHAPSFQRPGAGTFEQDLTIYTISGTGEASMAF